jgi:hypothetical protein
MSVKEDKAKRDLLDSIQIFPNGIYKITILLHNKRDEKMLEVSIFLERYFRSMHLKGFENM